MSSGFSFKFSKTSSKQLSDSKLRDASTKTLEEETDFVKSVDGKKIESTKKVEVKKDLVIPLISKNKWRSKEKSNDEKEENAVPKESVKGNLDDEAAMELLEDAKKQMDDWENQLEEGDHKKVDTVPMLMKNAIPKGFEGEDGTLDPSLRADESTLEDYENIPVQEYGLAMLRGMGWKPDEGIGGFKKQVIKSVDPVVRPKGLGLGAAKPKKADNSKRSKEEEDLSLVKGAYVVVESGAQKGMYGQVDGMDEETGRVFLKMALGSSTASVSENVIRVVTKKEYKECAKVINKEKYEEYKKKQDDREKDWERDRRKEGRDESDRKRRRSRSRSPKKKRSRSGSPSQKKKESYRNGSTPSWVYPHLKVRFIDKKYKGGKYFNSKMIVEDVTTLDSCVLRNCDNGRILEDIDPSHLETIIPKSDNAIVMIVRGKHKGQLGEILKRNKADCVAAVQLILKQEEILKLEYDDICEYTGEVPDF